MCRVRASVPHGRRPMVYPGIPDPTRVTQIALAGLSSIGLTWIQSYPNPRPEDMRFQLNPVVGEEAAAVAAAPRLRSVASKRLGFVDNSKLNADLFLAHVTAELSGRFGAVIGPIVRKLAPKDCLSTADFAELSKCDAVVQCFGDCGTSTSVSVADAVELERRGVPTVTVFSTAFADAARNQAAGRGMRNLHLVKVPHPMHTAPRAVVTERADAAVATIVERLTREAVENATNRSGAEAAAAAGDDQELFFERGRTDGLPVVTPTAEKVARMVAA